MRKVISLFAAACAFAACSSDDDDGTEANAATTVTVAVSSASSTVRSTAGAPKTSSTSSTTTTTLDASQVDPVVAVTDDGRVVTLKSNTGGELTQLGAVTVGDDGQAAGGVAVSQANGVVYFSGPYGETGRIWSVPVTGGDPEPIAPGSYPAISLDGTTLAFVRLPNTVVLFDIATRSQLAEVTWAADDQDFFNVGGTITRLEWSHDGSALVFQSNYEGSRTYVFRPGEHVTLSASELVADSLESPTWTGRDRILGVRRCCYPEYVDEHMMHIFRLGQGDEPELVIDRAVAAVDWRTNGNRSGEISVEQGSAAGTITLRNAAGRAAWTTRGHFITVSV